MDWRLITLIIINIVGSTWGLTCYKCTIRPQLNTRNYSKTHDRLCSQFDGSEKYAVDCPYSTFCMKRTYSLQLLKDKEVTITTRDCAAQKDSFRKYDGKDWVWYYNVIEDSYEEGCSNTEYGDQIKSNPEQYCYCKGNLCNGQSKKDTATHSDIMTVIFMFNAMKYVRSVL